jgi:hypothetical protein
VFSTLILAFISSDLRTPVGPLDEHARKKPCPALVRIALKEQPRLAIVIREEAGSPDSEEFHSPGLPSHEGFVAEKLFRRLLSLARSSYGGRKMFSNFVRNQSTAT